MDDPLKLKIAASLDLPTDAAADPEVARALADDPEARDYARGLHTIESALRRWPAPTRSDRDWEAFTARLDAKLDEASRERAKSRKGKKVSHEPDPAAIPVFTDATPTNPESKQAMSEPQENDADLENLAALTRTSTVPVGMPVASVRPSMASITDSVDDTSSGIVDIKKLAAIAREEAAKPAPAAVAKAPEAPAEKPVAKATKTDDVMVTPARAATPAPTLDAPQRKGGSTLWGAIGGMALMAGAFAIYTNMQQGPSSDATNPAAPAAAEAPQPAAAPEAPSASSVAAPAPAEAPAPVAAPAPPPQAEAEAAMAQRAVTDTAAATAESRHATNEPVPQARARAGASTPHSAREERAAPRPAAVEAPAAPVAAPAPTPAPRAAAAPAAPPAAAGGARSVDDLMNRVAGANGAAQAAAPAPAAELPERPTRGQITSVLSGLNNAVRTCTAGQTGTAPVAIVISNDGSVSSANVSGQFAGSAAGECISGVVGRAHFPRFRANEVRITYPFVILPPR